MRARLRMRAASLPPGAGGYLRADHPRLDELRRAYRSLDLAVTDHTLWSRDYVRSELDLRSFRADNAFVWQRREGNTGRSHALTVDYLESIDALGLLDRLTEDRYFGVEAFELDGGRLTSRDLVDSIAEIYFLERVLRLSSRPAVRVLDVGAGYGRLAHRLVAALPHARVLCVDAVAESTFLSEYYLGFRGVADRATVVELGDVEEALRDGSIDVACNVHSFSECSAAAVSWWLDLLKEHRVPYLMVVPNGETFLTREHDGTRADYLPLIESRGYRRIAAHPKYLDPRVQRHGVSPKLHFLFELGA